MCACVCVCVCVCVWVCVSVCVTVCVCVWSCVRRVWVELPCCEEEVGTAGWMKLESVWESSGGDWGWSFHLGFTSREKEYHHAPFIWGLIPGSQFEHGTLFCHKNNRIKTGTGFTHLPKKEFSDKNWPFKAFHRYIWISLPIWAEKTFSLYYGNAEKMLIFLIQVWYICLHLWYIKPDLHFFVIMV